jgi:hypothetical protein
MFCENIRLKVRLEFQIEIKQRHVVSCLHHKGMKLSEIAEELASVYHEQAFDESRVKYWSHQFKLHRSGLSDRPRSDRPSIEETDVQSLQV